jgi:hypothetical protein
LTQPQWSDNDPGAILKLLRGRVSDRKVRLFAAACCRTLWPQLSDPRTRNLLDVIERFADGEAGRDELEAARHQHPRKCIGGAFAVITASQIDPWAAAHATLAWFRGERLKWQGARRRANCQLEVPFNDIFSPPNPPPVIDAEVLAWQKGTVVRLAQAIYDERRFSDLPVLADALEDAGCMEEAVLRHCRRQEGHVLGCWLVDRLLGRE